MMPILALWATPRSTSTAFEWMMRQRGDLNCRHEPFGEAWYFGEDAKWPRRPAEQIPKAGLSFAAVWQALQADAESDAVFIKDFPHYVDHMWDEAFLAAFRHSFLIRDPAKVLTSMYKHWPSFELEEAGFTGQFALFERLTNETGKAPPIIDSDDLLENPAGVVEAYCGAVGIAYIAEALSWEPGARDEVSWYDGGSWHANLRDSDGLKPQPRAYVDITEAPDRIRAMYDRVLPLYEKMHRHRITV